MALALLGLTVFGYFSRSFLVPAVHRPLPLDTGTLTGSVFLSAIRSRELPAGLELPAFYDDPSLIGSLKQSAFAAKSPLLQVWFRLSSQEKVEVLTSVLWTGDPNWLVAFLAELAYNGSILEPEARIGDLIRASVQSLATPIPQVAIFLLDHIARTSPHDDVRQSAQRDVADLRLRLRDLGW